MAGKKDFKSKIKINTYEDIFGGPVSLNEVQYVDLKELHDFKNHPYHVNDDEDMDKLVESIKQQGILDPAIVRHREEGGYEIISGHRRHHAAIRAGLRDIPVIIRDIEDDEATLAMVDANLHREKLLPSEKAFAYKMKMEALSRQGKRTDLTSNQVGGKLSSAKEVGEGAGDSENQVRRYIRLTYLLPELLDMVDSKAIKFLPGVELSYMAQDDQRSLVDIIEKENVHPTLSQAKDLRRISKDGECTEAAIFKVLAVGSMKERRIVLGEDFLMRYFHADMTDDEMKRIIIRLLDDWADGRR